ncbi:MAG TPA: methyltransferase domain-containing protein [Gemmatimonadaceae bacterium]|nr:methyltransferase domain-containing protein [Gemmatimonadaceae bacterium]
MTTTDGVGLDTKGMVLRRAQARWYDLLAAAVTLGREHALRERLVEVARLVPGETVLDVGCGTGSLAIAAKRAVGATGAVTGVDASPDMIALATRKATRTNADVGFRIAVAERLPVPDGSFDVVLATLMLHHLPGPVRRECVREARRVLKPGGRILAVDFSRPSSRKGGLIARMHRHGGVSVDAMVALLRDSGMRVQETGSVGMSDLQYVVATAPAAGEQATPDDTIPATRSLPTIAPSRWIIPLVVTAAVAAHLLAVRRVAAHVTLTAAGLGAAALLLAVVAVHVVAARRAREH